MAGDTIVGAHVVANTAVLDDDDDCDCAKLVLDEVVPFCLNAVHNHPRDLLPDLVP